VSSNGEGSGGGASRRGRRDDDGGAAPLNPRNRRDSAAYGAE